MIRDTIQLDPAIYAGAAVTYQLYDTADAPVGGVVTPTEDPTVPAHWPVDYPAGFDGRIRVWADGVPLIVEEVNPARLAPDGLNGVEHPAMLHHAGHVVVDRTAGELRVYDADPAGGGTLLFSRDITETASTTTLGAAR
jgi:hypothetical protein